MLLGSPLREEISRSGSASPEVRNADSTCTECTTALTRYGSRVRPADSEVAMVRIIAKRFALCNTLLAMRNSRAGGRLRVEALVKSYGAVRALRGISFDLQAG